MLQSVLLLSTAAEVRKASYVNKSNITYVLKNTAVSINTAMDLTPSIIACMKKGYFSNVVTLHKDLW